MEIIECLFSSYVWISEKKAKKNPVVFDFDYALLLPFNMAYTSFYNTNIYIYLYVRLSEPHKWNFIFLPSLSICICNMCNIYEAQAHRQIHNLGEANGFFASAQLHFAHAFAHFKWINIFASTYIYILSWYEYICASMQCTSLASGPDNNNNSTFDTRKK